jgi:hypothetical protein
VNLTANTVTDADQRKSAVMASDREFGQNFPVFG